VRTRLRVRHDVEGAAGGAHVTQVQRVQRSAPDEPP
jgi:hypothetical protein